MVLPEPELAAAPVTEAVAEPATRPSFFRRIIGAPGRLLGFGQRHSAEAPRDTAAQTTAWNVEPSAQNGYRMSGIASWYGGYWHGRRTANGERYNQNSLTAAHRTLPFNTLVKVTNRNNGRSVVVRINNRGPHVRGRVLDLSVAAAKQIGSYSGGLAPVEAVVIGRAVR